MRKIREVLRLKFEGRLGHRSIAAACKVGLGTVSDYVARAARHGLDWPLPSELDDVALEEALFPGAPSFGESRSSPDFRAVHEELKGKGVTLQLLWHEYAEANATAYSYSQFCELYGRWRQKLSVSMRQVHLAGEKVFVDYAGTKMRLRTREGGQVDVEVFVGVLGASSYTYAEATADQTLPSWLMANERMLRYFEGSPEILVPDCLKSAVTTACRYEPLINRSYDDFARHYGAVVIPARPRKPQDKAKAELGVQVVTRWLIASLRKQEFFSLAELNAALRQRLEWLNNRPMKHLGASRRELFERVDRPALRPLPQAAFERRQWHEDVRVNEDYHVTVRDNAYSVPYQLAGKRVDACCTDTTVELFVGDRRVTSHQRLHGKGEASTRPEHMPKGHRAHAEWSSNLAQWREKAGPSTSRFIGQLVDQHAHPEQVQRACLGVMRLGRSYGGERLDAACARAESLGSFRYSTLKNILKNGQDHLPLTEAEAPATPRSRHDNIRGAQYYGSAASTGSSSQATTGEPSSAPQRATIARATDHGSVAAPGATGAAKEEPGRCGRSSRGDSPLDVDDGPGAAKEEVGCCGRSSRGDSPLDVDDGPGAAKEEAGCCGRSSRGDGALDVDDGPGAAKEEVGCCGRSSRGDGALDVDDGPGAAKEEVAEFLPGPAGLRQAEASNS